MTILPVPRPTLLTKRFVLQIESWSEREDSFVVTAADL
jgi:hypothetical protein